MRRLFSLALILFAIGGCDQNRQANNASNLSRAKAFKPASKSKMQATKTITINVSTPDLALKSWWHLLDAAADEMQASCRQYHPKTDYIALQRRRLMTGDIEKFFSMREDNCSRESYDREIDEVKVESESRAVITATIKNVTTLPSNVHLTDREEEIRNKGSQFKYVVERPSPQAGWKISEVLKYSDYPINGTNWDPEYDWKYVDKHDYVLGSQ